MILNAFEDSEITAFQFLHELLLSNTFEDHPVTLSIVEDLDAILDTVKSAGATSDQTERWVFRGAEQGYQAQLLQLTKKESGFHFLPSKITNAQLMETKIENLSKQMNHHAPDLWRLVANLLAADPAADRRRAQFACRKASSATQKANPRSYNARAVLTWYQQGRFPNFACTRSRTSWTVHSRGVVGTIVVLWIEEAVGDVLIASEFLRISGQGIFPKWCG